MRTVNDLGLVFMDTFSRAMAGYDENSGADMMAIVGGMDRIRRETGACVLVVHHSGKDTKQGARGHSSLLCAVDTEIRVSRAKDDGALIEINATKQRDLPTGPVGVCRLRSMPLGYDGVGEQVFSCVVVDASHSHDLPKAVALPSVVSSSNCGIPNTTASCAHLIGLLPQPSTTHWQIEAESKIKVKRQNFYGQLKIIKEKGLAIKNGKAWTSIPFGPVSS